MPPQTESNAELAEPGVQFEHQSKDYISFCKKNTKGKFVKVERRNEDKDGNVTARTVFTGKE